MRALKRRRRMKKGEFNMEQTINGVGNITVSESTPVISVSPIIIAAPERGEDLPVRVSAPLTGDNLPIIVFAHGNGKSLDSYAPLVQFWAAHGFVGLQCTHLDSRRLQLDPENPRTPSIYKFRVQDAKSMLDNLDLIETLVPALKGRIDRGSWPFFWLSNGWFANGRARCGTRWQIGRGYV